MFEQIIDEYFKSKKINVSYNTLAGNESMIRAYVNEFQLLVDSSKHKLSQNVKFECYNRIYKLEPRQKYTGFENLQKLDLKFRERARREITPLFWAHSVQFPKDENILVLGMSYKDLLKQKVRSFKNPLLYFSGGLDSELVAKSFLDAKKKFTPVIFEWYNNRGELINEYDIIYAFNFCKNYYLRPIVKKINIEKLWEDKEFFDLALKSKITSPHILTHIFMIELMEKEYSGIDHVFGGEVRFHANITDIDDRSANLIVLNKANPMPFDGQTFTTVAASYGTAIAGITLNKTGASGSWLKFEGSPTGGSSTFMGYWWNDPPRIDSKYGTTQIRETVRFQTTLNSLTSSGTVGTEVQWSANNDWNGWANPSVGSTLSLYIGATSSYGPDVFADTGGGPTIASVNSNWTMVITSYANGASGINPVSVSATFSLVASSPLTA